LRAGLPVAAVDIGTNSVLLLIAHLGGSGLEVVEERAKVTRLGEGVDRSGMLAVGAVERTLDYLVEIHQILGARGVGHLDVVATSVLRDAREGREFLDRAETILGVRPRIITGEEEGRLSFVGGVSGLGCRGTVLLVDPGGGSTELCWGEVSGGVARLVSVASIDVGCVRLTERHVRTDPPSKSEMEAVARDVKRELGQVKHSCLGCSMVVAGGTATTLVAMQERMSVFDATRVHGAKLLREDIDGMLARIVGVGHAQRCRWAGLESGRADVIAAGTMILGCLLEWSKQSELTVSARGLRWGLAESLGRRS
jgi:exopolyphosphatase / guanosine-5'-triphosphate,3'-diphosphate pyrophosphatase